MTDPGREACRRTARDRARVRLPELAGTEGRDGSAAGADARHHIFSAIALGDLDLVGLVEAHPDCLLRRRSRFENEQTPLHAAFARPMDWGRGQKGTNQ